MNLSDRGLLEIINFPLTRWLLFFLHCLIGAIAAKVAKEKGYSLWQWVILGMIGGTAALICSLWIKPKNL